MPLKLLYRRQTEMTPWPNTDIQAVPLACRKSLLILLITTSVLLGGCTIKRPTAPSTPASAATATTNELAVIKMLYAHKAAALTARDTASLTKCYEEDAVQFPPNSAALIGWDEIRAEFESELEGIKVTATIKVAEAVVADHWTFARGTYQLVTVPQGGGEETMVTGNWLDILKRQPDSSWKIARSTWSIEE